MKKKEDLVSGELSDRGRREFVQKVSLAALSLALPFPRSKSLRMGIVVHSYGFRWNSKVESKLYPGFANAIDLLEHAKRLGAGGIQVGVGNWTADFTKRMRTRREELDLYLEGSISLPHSSAELERFEQDVVHAREAGATILRSVASTGRRYEALHSKAEFDESKKNALQSIQLAVPVLTKYKMKLAVENHKDWFATELVDMIKKIGSEYAGVTLDFGNSIALLENPMDVVRALAPYAFSTHVKDMAVEEYKDGFLLSEVPLGTGILDLPEMVRTCRQYNRDIHFSLEMITRDPLEIPCLRDEYWETMNPAHRARDVAKMMDIVKKHKYNGALPHTSHLTPEQKLAFEEQNIVHCLDYSEATLELD